MLFRSFQSILDECVAALRQGETVEACLARYPRQENRLRPYLELAARVGATPQVLVRPVAQATAWSAVRERAAELRVGKRRRRAVRTASYGAWLRPVAAAMVAVAALVAATGGTALAAQEAMPDSPLYRVKLASEDVHLWLVFDEESEAQILLDQSQERTKEIRAMSRDGKEIPGVVLDALRNRNERAAAIIADKPNAIDLREQLRSQALAQENLLVAVQSDVEQSASSDYREAFASVHNSYFLGTGAFASALLSEELADGVQEVSGVVEQGEDGSWTVGGISVGVDGRTISGQDLVQGATAELIVGVSSNGKRHALSVSRISVSPTPSNVIVSGEIEEVTADSITIAGQTIPITPETILKGKPKKGQRVSVQLNNADAGLVASEASSFSFEGMMETDLGRETKELVVSGQTFSITPDMSIDTKAGSATEGARVQVEAAADDDGDIKAQSLTVLATDDQDESVYLVGAFEGARQGIWIVGSVELGSPPGNAEEPEPGSLVAIDARETDGLLDVTGFFVIQQPDETLIRLEGTATTIDGTVWNFGFGEVTVDSTAEVSGRALAGARAIIWGSKDQTGAIDAVYVHVMDRRPVVSAPGEQPSDDDQ